MRKAKRYAILITPAEYKEILLYLIIYCIDQGIYWTEITDSFIRFQIEEVFKIDKMKVTRDLIRKMKADLIRYLKKYYMETKEKFME